VQNRNDYKGDLSKIIVYNMGKIIKKGKKEYYVMNPLESFIYNLEHIPFIGAIVRVFTGTIQDP
jgi:hypothetical protein